MESADGDGVVFAAVVFAVAVVVVDDVDDVDGNDDDGDDDYKWSQPLILALPV